MGKMVWIEIQPDLWVHVTEEKAELLELAGREKAGTTRPPEDKMLPRVQNKALPKTANKGGEA